MDPFLPVERVKLLAHFGSRLDCLFVVVLITGGVEHDAVVQH